MTLLTKLLKTMEKNYVAKIQVNQKMRNSKPQKRIQLKLTGTVLGSPPHVREELVPIDEWINSDQDHPRMCGKNSRSRCIASWRLGSPRACGKNLHWTAARYDQTGSPPRMREEWLFNRATCSSIGITPAHAGRICRGGSGLQCYVGSPPRMREELLPEM